MKTLQHYFTRTLLSICTLLCIMPAMVQAQLFGGMIKAQKPIAVVIPANITLGTSKPYFVASVYDNDYLPYTTPTGPGTTATQAADGTNESYAVNVQGTITTTGVTVYIPATATGSGTLPACTIKVTVPSTLAQDGISRDLTLSWPSTNYDTYTTSITANLQAVGGTLNVKKLDINAGLGNDAQGVLLAQFVYPTTTTGPTTTFSVRAIVGIPDKMFGLADNTGQIEHNFLYLPVADSKGKIWLNNNLGANYANINNPSFNPALGAEQGDFNSYGSLFQWGRKPDGHELTVWSQYGFIITGTTSTRSDSPSHALFINNPSSEDPEWRNNPDGTLWATESSANNPCPRGFRIPAYTEITSLAVPPCGGRACRDFSSNVDVFYGYAGDPNLGTSPPRGAIWTREYTYKDYSGWFPAPSRASAYGSPAGWYTFPDNGNAVRCVQD